MAEPRNARLTHAEALGPETRLLTFQIEDPRPLGFLGGQYVIVNTGMPLPGGKVAKRAYSILSADSEQDRFQIAVRRIGSGPGSNFMHALSVGSELTFSGPWGRFFPEEDELDVPTLVFATDTGITAALGLLRSSRLNRSLSAMRLVWLVDSLDYFISEAMVREALGRAEPRERPEYTAPPLKGGGSPEVVFHPTGLPVHHAERPAQALMLLGKLCGDVKPKRAFLSGDGAILIPLAEELKAMGFAESAIRMECFFNNPNRKAP